MAESRLVNEETRPTRKLTRNSINRLNGEQAREQAKQIMTHVAFKHYQTLDSYYAYYTLHEQQRTC